MEFLNEHMNELQSEQERMIAKLAWEYHERCEAYDKRVCTATKGKIAMPANGDEAKLINRNAQAVIDEIVASRPDIADFRDLLKAAIVDTSLAFEKKLRGV